MLRFQVLLELIQAVGCADTILIVTAVHVRPLSVRVLQEIFRASLSRPGLCDCSAAIRVAHLKAGFSLSTRRNRNNQGETAVSAHFPLENFDEMELDGSHLRLPELVATPTVRAARRADDHSRAVRAARTPPQTRRCLHQVVNDPVNDATD